MPLCFPLLQLRCWHHHQQGRGSLELTPATHSAHALSNATPFNLRSTRKFSSVQHTAQHTQYAHHSIGEILSAVAPFSAAPSNMTRERESAAPSNMHFPVERGGKPGAQLSSTQQQSTAPPPHPAPSPALTTCSTQQHSPHVQHSTLSPAAHLAPSPALTARLTGMPQS